MLSLQQEGKWELINRYPYVVFNLPLHKIWGRNVVGNIMMSAPLYITAGVSPDYDSCLMICSRPKVMCNVKKCLFFIKVGPPLS